MIKITQKPFLRTYNVSKRYLEERIWENMSPKQNSSCFLFLYSSLSNLNSFRESPAKYTKLIEGQDREGILKELTDAPVEERVIRRVASKAERYSHPKGYYSV